MATAGNMTPPKMYSSSNRLVRIPTSLAFKGYPGLSQYRKHASRALLPIVMPGQTEITKAICLKSYGCRCPKAVVSLCWQAMMIRSMQIFSNHTLYRRIVYAEYVIVG